MLQGLGSFGTNILNHAGEKAMQGFWTIIGKPVLHVNDESNALKDLLWIMPRYAKDMATYIEIRGKYTSSESLLNLLQVLQELTTTEN